jgi:malate/lactate dehydrogenase
MNGRNFLKPSEISVETQDAAQIKVNNKKLTNQNNYKRLSDFEVILLSTGRPSE